MSALALAFSGQKEISVRYGISFISTEQARKNLEREINSYDVDAIARIGRNEWNGGQVTLDSVRVFDPCPHHLIPTTDADDLFPVFAGAYNCIGYAVCPQALQV